MQGQGIKLVVVDATAEQRLAQKYEVRGYPTIKIFGENKRKPTTYEGGRDGATLIREFKKLAKGGAGGSKGTGASGSRGEPEKPKPKPKPRGGSAGEGARASGGGSGGGHGGAQQGFAATPSVELTDETFKLTVLESDTPWLVAFYGAPVWWMTVVEAR